MPCRECANYVSLKNEANPQEQGLCRRFPPVMLVTQMGRPADLTTAFPTVLPDWACDEFKARKRNAPMRVIDVTPLKEAAA